MRHSRKTLVAALVLILAPVDPGPYAGELPEGPLILLAQAVADPCSICADQKRETAFSALNKRLPPGLEITCTDACRLVKAERDNALLLGCYPSFALADSLNEGEELPQVEFTFYTPQKKLVGISEIDCTGKRISDLYQKSPPGTVFQGRIMLIAYKYGHGRTFHYFRQTNRLQIHCVVSELKPMESR